MYGCGDFLNDYEGIAGYEEFRDDLVVMYLPRLATSSGQLVNLRLIPFQVRKFRLTRTTEADAAWLRGTLRRESSRFGVEVQPSEDDTLSVTW